MIYIYELRCPIKKVVRYIGATSKPKSRFKQHIKDTGENKKTAKTKKQEWISWLRKQQMTPVMNILHTEEDKQKGRKLEEQEVIKNIKTVFNLHMPGKGSLSVEHFKKTGKLKNTI